MYRFLRNTVLPRFVASVGSDILPYNNSPFANLLLLFFNTANAISVGDVKFNEYFLRPGVSVFLTNHLRSPMHIYISSSLHIFKYLKTYFFLL